MNGKSRNKQFINSHQSVKTALSAGTIGMNINNSSIGRVSRTKQSVHRLLSLGSTGVAYRDETCAADSSDEDSSQGRPMGIRSRFKQAKNLEMTGVSCRFKRDNTAHSHSPLQLPLPEFHSSEKNRAI